MKTLIINAHPDPHSACSATNRMVAHLLAKLPAGSAEVVNLAESKQPSLDKAVLDIFIKTVPDETFRYNANGNPDGLLTTHKALILQASGGVFSEGGRAAMEHTVPYLQDVLRLLGFVSVDAVRAEGTTKTTGLDAAVAKACADIDAKMDTFTR